MKESQENKNEITPPKVTVTARNLDTKEIIYQSTNGEEVIRKAEEHGEEYILDFDSEEKHNFLL